MIIGPTEITETLAKLKKIMHCGEMYQKTKVDICKRILQHYEKTEGPHGVLYHIGDNYKAVVIPNDEDIVFLFEDYDKAFNYFIKLNN